MENSADIVFEHVTFSYARDAKPALRDIDMHVDGSAFVAVLGANGSGKSTLAKHVNGLLVPDEGCVRVGGLSTADTDASLTVRRSVGMVFQNPDDQAVASQVRDDVAFGPENLGLDPHEIRARTDEALAQVGMSEYADSQIHELSGGQKQLVAIAGALAMHPKLLVLDEPGAMLDVRGRERITQLARTLNAQGTGVMLVTHFIDEALDADRVIVLDRGRVALAGSPAEVLARADKLRALRLEPPFAVALSGLLREQGVAVGESTVTEAALIEALAHANGPQSQTADADGPPPQPVAAHTTCKAGEKAPTLPHVQPAGQSGSDAESIVFDHVGFRYDAAKTAALDDVSFTLHRGKVWGLAGHTGSGKSTLAQLADALLTPSSGRVLVDGLDTADKRSRRAVRERVGVAFQYPEQQLFAATVEQDVAFGPRNLGLDAAQAEQASREALAALGLDYDELAQRSPFQLSGGQQRRVALAGILAMRPRYLVLDEPCAGMDPAATRELVGQLRAFAADGMGLLFISHSMDDIARLCDGVTVLENGRVLLQGTPQEMFSDEHAARLEQTGLGLPRAAALAAKLRGYGYGFPTLPLTPEALAEALSRKRA